MSGDVSGRIFAVANPKLCLEAADDIRSNGVVKEGNTIDGYRPSILCDVIARDAHDKHFDRIKSINATAQPLSINVGRFHKQRWETGERIEVPSGVILFIIALTDLDATNGMFGLFKEPQEPSIAQTQASEQLSLNAGEGIIWEAGSMAKSRNGEGGIFLMIPYIPSGNAATSGLNIAQGDLEGTPDFVPKSAVSSLVYSEAVAGLQPAILNHSIRVYFYAKAMAEREDSKWATDACLPLLFAACICHDMGTCSSTDDDPQRFEVTGADQAARILRSQDVSDADVHEVWVAIALHTSPHIAERISSLARLVRVAVLADFGRLPVAMENFSADVNVAGTERTFPRVEVEKVLGDVVVKQALRRPEKAPAATWPGGMVKATLEDQSWDGVNKAF